MPVLHSTFRCATTQSQRFFSKINALQLPIKPRPHAKYGGRHVVTALPGDGIGPEMLKHIDKIFKFANIPVDFEYVDVSSRDPTNDSLQNAITSIKRNGLAIKGNIETKFDNPEFLSRNMELRRVLDLYVNVLHCVSIPTIPARRKNLDIVLIRENTEGEYSGLEHQSVEGVVESLKIVTRRNTERIARFAFDYALLNNRLKITAIHKANIQKLGDGLFLRICRDLAASQQYKGIEFDAMIVDNASMQLVANPEQFNGGILLSPNLYGNIISNIACGLVGGPGLVSGMNIGNQYAVFETGTRNTGTSLINKDEANPTAFICAAVDMLNYLGLFEASNHLADALYKTLTVDKIHTPDIGGHSKSSDLINSVLDNLQEITQ